MAIKAKLLKNNFALLATQLDRRKATIVAQTKADIVESARLLVPYVTGRLWRSIRATVTGVEANAPYAAMIEYGELPSRRPQPYLTPAVEFHRRRMMIRLREELFAERDPSDQRTRPTKGQLLQFLTGPSNDA